MEILFEIFTRDEYLIDKIDWFLLDVKSINVSHCKKVITRMNVLDIILCDLILKTREL